MMLSDDVAANNPRAEPEKPMDKQAECDRLQTENSNLHKHVAELAEERDRLQIENENLRAELQRAGTELGTLRAVSFASVAKLEGT